VPTMSNSEEKKRDITPQSLTKFLRSDSDAMHKLLSFLDLRAIGNLRRTSTGNQNFLKNYTTDKIHRSLVKSRVIWYLNYSGEWVLAIIACVVNDGTGNQAYHVMPVKRGETETLFDHEVPWCISTDPRYPDYSEYPVGPKLYTHYGNVGSRTARNSHVACTGGFCTPGCPGPDAFKSTISPECNVYAKTAPQKITPENVGAVMNTSGFMTAMNISIARDYLKERRPGVPVNRPNGYSPEAVKALDNYAECVDKVISAPKGFDDCDVVRNATIALNILFDSMPDIPRTESLENDRPCGCPNWMLLESFHSDWIPPIHFERESELDEDL
jgi:hypothetical protein